MGKHSATLRFQLTNLFDDYVWNVTEFGGFRRASPRRASATLSLDF